MGQTKMIVRLLGGAAVGGFLLLIVLLSVGASAYAPQHASALVATGLSAPGLSGNTWTEFVTTSPLPAASAAFTHEPDQTGGVVWTDFEKTTTGSPIDLGMELTVLQLPSAAQAREARTQAEPAVASARIGVPEASAPESGRVITLTSQRQAGTTFAVPGVPGAVAYEVTLSLGAGSTTSVPGYQVLFRADDAVVDLVLEGSTAVSVTDAVTAAQREYRHLITLEPTFSLTTSNPLFYSLLVFELVVVVIEGGGALLLLRIHRTRMPSAAHQSVLQVQLEDAYRKFSEGEAARSPGTTASPPSTGAAAAEVAPGGVPAGWYPVDSADPPRLRWWDGTAWTAHYHSPTGPAQ